MRKVFFATQKERDAALTSHTVLGKGYDDAGNPEQPFYIEVADETDDKPDEDKCTHHYISTSKIVQNGDSYKSVDYFKCQKCGKETVISEKTSITPSKTFAQQRLIDQTKQGHNRMFIVVHVEPQDEDNTSLAILGPYSTEEKAKENAERYAKINFTEGQWFWGQTDFDEPPYIKEESGSTFVVVIERKVDEEIVSLKTCLDSTYWVSSGELMQ